MNIRILATYFAALLFNIVMATFLFAYGLTSGFEGTNSFSMDNYWRTLGILFGDVPSLLAILAIAVIAASAIYGIVALSRKGHHYLVGLCAVVAFVVGILVADRYINLDELGWGWVSLVGIALATAVEILLFRLFSWIQDAISKRRTKRRAAKQPSATPAGA